MVMQGWPFEEVDLVKPVHNQQAQESHQQAQRSFVDEEKRNEDLVEIIGIAPLKRVDR